MFFTPVRATLAVSAVIALSGVALEPRPSSMAEITFSASNHPTPARIASGQYSTPGLFAVTAITETTPAVAAVAAVLNATKYLSTGTTKSQFVDPRY